MTQTIHHQETESKGAFFVEQDHKRLAEMTYSKAGPAMIIIDHTEVDEQLRGSGVGEALVGAAVNWAREHEIKIMPLCPFAASVFRKHPEFRDVLQ